MLELLVKR